MPANSEPSITESAPAAIAFVMSPVCFIPPSAITVTPLPSRALLTLYIADNCG